MVQGKSNRSQPGLAESLARGTSNRQTVRIHLELGAARSLASASCVLHHENVFNGCSGMALVDDAMNSCVVALLFRLSSTTSQHEAVQLGRRDANHVFSAEGNGQDLRPTRAEFGKLR